jgi:hypothetical protein
MLVDARSVSSVAIARPEKVILQKKNNATPKPPCFAVASPRPADLAARLCPEPCPFPMPSAKEESREKKHRIRVEMRRQKDQVKAKRDRKANARLLIPQKQAKSKRHVKLR